MNTSDTQAVIDITRESVRPKELAVGAIYLVTDADGTQSVIDTDAYSESPRWTARTVTFRDVESFGQYLTKHYDTGQPYKVTARLRYRMSGGALSIGFKLIDPDAIVRAAVGDVIAALTPLLPDNIPVWHGKSSA